MLYGCTSWPWVYKKAFIGTKADLETAKLFHPCPGDVTWYCTNPVAGAISVVGLDTFFVPATDFYGHCFVIGVHASVRCIIPFWVVPDHTPLASQNWPATHPTFCVYPNISCIQAAGGFIRPRTGAWNFNNAFHPNVKWNAGAALNPLHDYYGYLWLQDNYSIAASGYRVRTDYPFATEVVRTLACTGDPIAGELDIVGTLTGGSLAATFHLVIEAPHFGGPSNGWAVLDAANGEYGTSVVSVNPMDATFHCTLPGVYGVLATDAWDGFHFDTTHTPEIT